jgi:hypothetical protein
MHMTAGSTLRMLAGRFCAQLAVIVLGVLIALWADAWVKSRADRSTETARLAALRLNVDTTLNELRTYGGEIDGTTEALRNLLALESAGPGDPDIFDLLLRGLIGVPMLDAQLNVYDDLKNSGELSLLEDPEVRQALSEMDARLQNIAAAQSDLSIVQQWNVDPYLIRQLDLVPLVAAFYGLERRPEHERPAMALDFLGDREFRNLVAFKLDILLGISRAADRLERALLRVQAAIDTRLEELH